DVIEYKWLSVFPTTDNRLDTMWIVQIATKRVDYFDTPCLYTSSGDYQWSGTKIYPNPAYDFLHIESENILTNVWIYDIDGKKESVPKPNDVTDRVDISCLTPGVKRSEMINSHGQVYRTKFVKM